jgi:hypothetical protein
MENIITFDEWRSKYDGMSLAEQVEYHNQLEHLYPEQAHYNYGNVREALQLAVPSPKVLEFGCWKGDLAQRAIPEFNVKSWKGVEICDAAIKNTHCTRDEFSYIVPDKFDWFDEQRTEEADIIIATHFIEHLSNNHFDKLAIYCKGVKVIYFEAPLTQDGQNWEGYVGTHKLFYGWKDVTNVMSSVGFKVEKVLNDSIIFICE